MTAGPDDYETNWQELALAALRWCWEGAYAVWMDDDVWTAQRLHNGYMMTAATPDGLASLILADCAARPVRAG